MVKLTPKEAAEKWKRKGAASTKDYELGIKKGKDWQKNTLAAKDSYESGVQESIADDKFSKGVGRISTDEQREKTLKKSSRFADGINKGEEDFENEIIAVFNHIDDGIDNLPAAGPKRSAANKARMDFWFDHMSEFEKE